MFRKEVKRMQVEYQNSFLAFDKPMCYILPRFNQCFLGFLESEFSDYTHVLSVHRYVHAPDYISISKSEKRTYVIMIIF